MPTPQPQAAAGLLDELLPTYDVSDAVAVTVEADAATTWGALLEADLIEVGRRKPLVGALGAVRILPQLLADGVRGRGLPTTPKSLRLGELAGESSAEGDWILLGERSGSELALGLVGKFWRPVIAYADVTADGFRDFDEPGWAKTVYDLRVAALDDARSLVTGTMRTATTDAAARRWFRRYWTLGVGPGAHILVAGLLDVVAEDAAKAAAATTG